MCNCLVIAILTVFVVTNQQKGTTVGAPPVSLSAPQWDLLFGVYKVQNWRDSWFTAIADADGWMGVHERLLSLRARPGSLKKLLLIPRMMGCDCGAKLYWFLSLAVYVVKECERFSQDNDGSRVVAGLARDCWNRLGDGVRRGSNTVSEVMGSLGYTHYTVGDNVGSDEFYKNVSRIRGFLSTVLTSQDITNFCVKRTDELTDCLQDFLHFNCAPEYPPFDIEQLMTEHETAYRHICSYLFYLNKMDSYVRYVSTRLIQLGFLYDAATGQTTFKKWVEDLSDQLDCLNNTGDTRNVRQCLEQSCETHNEPLTVFCATCNLSICHRCALFDNSSHISHSFRPIEEIYNETLTKLEDECDNLKGKEELIKKDIKEIDKNIKDVQQAKDQKVREIRTAIECMMMDLEKDLDTKLTTLLRQKGHLVHEAEQIEEFLHDCDLEVSQMTMSQLISNAPRFMRTVTIMQQKQAPLLIPVYPEFHSAVTPKFEGGTLTIKSFSEKITQSEPIYSLPIGCNGVSWRLKVYPNGNGIVRDRYLSVFLELTSGPPGVSRYEYRIEMINQLNINDPSKNVLREFTSNFEIGECWGYNRFFRLDLLENEGFLQRNSLILKFSVRPPTYYQKCIEQQWYLSKLELENSLLVQKCDELKQKVPAKVKPVIKEVSSPKKKLKIKIQSLLDEFESVEATGSIDKNPNEDHGSQGGSCGIEIASNSVLPPFSLQNLYDSELPIRFQGETAQSMFERLSRLFQENEIIPERPINVGSINNSLLNNVEQPSQPDFNLDNRLRVYGVNHFNSPKRLRVAENAQMVNKIQSEITEARFRLTKLENAMLNSQTIAESFSEPTSSIPNNLTLATNSVELLQSNLEHDLMHELHGATNSNTLSMENGETEEQGTSEDSFLKNLTKGLDEMLCLEDVYKDNWDIAESSSSESESSPSDEPVGPGHLSQN